MSLLTRRGMPQDQVWTLDELAVVPADGSMEILDHQQAVHFINDGRVCRHIGSGVPRTMQLPVRM